MAEKEKKRKRGCMMWALGIVVAVPALTVGSYYACTTPEERAEMQAELEAERAAAEEAERQAAIDARAEELQERRAGFHCLSAWNGTHPAFVRAVKARLNDPDSFEHDATRVASVNDAGKHRIEMTFRARNAFGGMVRSTATGTYRQADCDAVEVLLIQ